MATRQSSKDNGAGSFGPWHRFHRYPRLTACTAIFVVLTIALVFGGLSPVLGVLLAFDLAALIFLAATLYMILHADEHSLRQRARREDQSYWGFLLSSAAVSVIAVVALAIELHASRSGGLLEVALAASSLLLAWLFMNTILRCITRMNFTATGAARAAASISPAPANRITGTLSISRLSSA